MRYASLVLIVLIALPAALGAQTNVSYDVIEDSAQITYSISLDDQSVELPLPTDAKQLTVSGEIVEPTNRLVLEGTGTFEVSFLTQSVLEDTGEKHLIDDLSDIPGELVEVRVELPPGARLVEDLNSAAPSIRPGPTQATTDGTRLIFVWTNDALEPSQAFFVTYQQPREAAPIWLIALVIIIAALGAWYVARNTGTKSFKDVTRNLFEDEKRLADILLGADEDGMWQKRLVEKSGMSKVKVSRKLRNLEAKGVIEKIPHGNTNRIRLKD